MGSRKILLLSIILLCPVILNAQVRKRSLPPSFIAAQLPESVPVEKMQEIDVQKLMLEDAIYDSIKDRPWRFGKNLTVNLNPGNSGVWDELPDGGRLWRLGISSPGAYTINLTFDQYRLPPGAELFLYNSDRSYMLGAFTDYNNQEDGYFATSLVPGDSVIVEYYEPTGVEFHGELNIETVTHAYRDPGNFTKAFGDSGACNMNVACSDAQGWQDQINATVMLVAGSNGFCSGVLINNTNNDGTPYLLSADHCFRQPSTLVVWFNWQSTTCNNPPSSPPFDAMSGAVLRARYQPSDFWLVELNQPVPIEYNPYFAGWNRALDANIAGMITGVHHPRGDIKKFSYALDGIQASQYLGAPGSGTTHWRIVWSGGTTTEGGSSGSPIFDSEGRILGQLHGGYAACGNTLPDWYGRMGVSWTGGGLSSNRLMDWLDPAGIDPPAWQGFNPAASFVDNPESFFAQTVSPDQINLSWEKNQLQHPVVIAASSIDQFGSPSGAYLPGEQIAQGGTVIYVGENNLFQHQGLEPSTTYFYKAWSFDESYNYSSGITTQAETFDEDGPTLFQVNLQASPENGGTVNGQGTYAGGTQTTVTAYPAHGWEFLNWTEAQQVVSTQASYTFIVEANRDLVANFQLQSFMISAQADPAIAGEVTGDGMFFWGEIASLSATPYQGWEFIGWKENDEMVSFENPWKFQVFNNRELSAVFESFYRDLTVQVQGKGFTEPPPGVYAFLLGEKIILNATADNQWFFSKWIVNGEDFFSPYIMVEIDDNVLAVAVFRDSTSDQLLPFDQRISIYPVPAAGTLHIDLKTLSGNFNLSINNLNGQVVRQIDVLLPAVEHNNVKMDLSGIRTGVYVLRISNDNETFSRKLIIHQENH
jgi:hypothetical protein